MIHPNHQKIYFVGAPGTGKSTLAQAVNVALKMEGHDAEFCAEFARTYLRSSGPPVSPLEQFVILSGASDREDELKIHNFTVCDSASFLSEVYYTYVIKRLSPDLSSAKIEQGLEEIRRLCRKRLLEAEHIFYVPPRLFDSGPDPTRAYTEDVEWLDERFKAYLTNNGADYTVVESIDLEERVAEVMASLRYRDAFQRGL
jgi:hypothetical protein